MPPTIANPIPRSNVVGVTGACNETVDVVALD
jgi:hypothetical protein